MAHDVSKPRRFGQKIDVLIGVFFTPDAILAFSRPIVRQKKRQGVFGLKHAVLLV
jgi:hypothetical protein